MFDADDLYIPPREPNRPRVGIGVIVWKDGKILLGKRIGKFGYGFYSFPGGKLDYMETVIECAHRELLEETGLKISNPVFAGYTDDLHKTSEHYVTLYVEGDYESGELENREPDKTESWNWYDPKELPEPLWEPIKAFFKNSLFSY